MCCAARGSRPRAAEAGRLQNDAQRHAAVTTVVGWITARGPPRGGTDAARAADLLWTLTSPEVHHMRLEVRGRTREQQGTRLGHTHAHALLGPQAVRYPNTARTHRHR